jgi:hypothetical protein
LFEPRFLKISPFICTAAKVGEPGGDREKIRIRDSTGEKAAAAGIARDKVDDFFLDRYFLVTLCPPKRT